MKDASSKKNPDNPFARLDAARFRSSPAPAKAKRPAPADDLPQDPEEALFVRAMSQVKPIPKEEKAPARDPLARLAPLDTLEMKDDSELFARALQKSRKPKPAPPPAPSTPREERASPLADALGLADPDAEAHSFLSAIKGVAPLAGKGREVPPEPAPVPPAPESNPLQDFLDGKLEFALSASDEYVEGHVVGLDMLTVGKLQSRQYSPEMHIDLHGLNSEQAFHNLVHFFRGAYLKGARTVLVVTGRGLNSPDGSPVLRAKIQQWLTQDPFRRVVLAFCTAKREDGGPGALYVLLRKFRKSAGKVRWDALPADPDLFL